MPTSRNLAKRTTILFSTALRYSHLHMGIADPTLQIQEHGINITINQRSKLIFMQLHCLINSK